MLTRLACASIGLLALFASFACDDEPAPDLSPSPPPEPSTPEEFLERVQASLGRDGSVARIQAETLHITPGGAQPQWTIDFWIDPENERSRLHWTKDPSVTLDIAEEVIEILAEGYRYSVNPQGDDRVTRYLQTETPGCFQGEPQLLVTALLCAVAPLHQTDGLMEIEGIVDFKGREVRSLTLRDSRSTPTNDYGTHRLLVDPETYAPVAHTVTSTSAPAGESLETEYAVSFEPRDSLDSGHFDPRALGYVTPEEEELSILDDAAIDVPIYWPGRELPASTGYDATLGRVTDHHPGSLPRGDEPETLVALSYGGPSGFFRLDYWRPGRWEDFRERLGSGFQWAECSAERAISLEGAELVILQGFELPLRPGESPSASGPPDLFPDGCPDRPYDHFMAVIRYPDVTVTVNAPYGYGPEPIDESAFDTEAGLEAIARSLVPRRPGE